MASWASWDTLLSAVLFFVYIGVGTLFFSVMDEKSCESDAALLDPDYDPDTCMEAWTAIDSLYFSLVTMSTVGYGDFTPTNGLSKAFTVFYIIFGVTVVWVRVYKVISKRISMWMEAFAREVDIIASSWRGNSAMFWIRGLGLNVIGSLVLQLLFASIFRYTEGISFGDAFYHCIVTATTVGYGDISLTKQSSRLWAAVHILVSVTWLAAFIAHIDELRAAQRLEQKRIELLNKPLDVEKVLELDRDGGGIDKCEFVIGMMMALGAEFDGCPLQWKDVDPFIKRFNAMEHDENMKLSVEDLIHGIMEHHEERQARNGELMRTRSGSRVLPERSGSGAFSDIATLKEKKLPRNPARPGPAESPVPEPELHRQGLSPRNKGSCSEAEPELQKQGPSCNPSQGSTIIYSPGPQELN